LDFRFWIYAFIAHKPQSARGKFGDRSIALTRFGGVSLRLRGWHARRNGNLYKKAKKKS
jgi:hypothetical protein